MKRRHRIAASAVVALGLVLAPAATAVADPVNGVPPGPPFQPPGPPEYPPGKAKGPRVVSTEFQPVRSTTPYDGGGPSATLAVAAVAGAAMVGSVVVRRRRRTG